MGPLSGHFYGTLTHSKYMHKRCSERLPVIQSCLAVQECMCYASPMSQPEWNYQTLHFDAFVIKQFNVSSF